MKYQQGDAEKLRKKFWTALADSPFLFLQLENDSSSCVPMSPQLDKNADSAIWFFANKQSKFAALGNATATFQGKGHELYARFHGQLTVETSRDRFEQFWSNPVAAWFDGGKDDPDILFLRMDLGQAEIWDGDMGLLDTAKLALGKSMRDDASEKHVETTL